MHNRSPRTNNNRNLLTPTTRVPSATQPRRSSHRTKAASTSYPIPILTFSQPLASLRSSVVRHVHSLHIRVATRSTVWTQLTTKAAAGIVGLFYLAQVLRRNLPALLSVEVVFSMPGDMARRGVYAATVGLPRQLLTKQSASLHAAQLRLARPAPLPVAMAAHKYQKTPFAKVSFAWLC